MSDAIRADSYKSAFEKQKLELAEKDREILSIKYELEDAFIDLAKRDELLEEAKDLINAYDGNRVHHRGCAMCKWLDRYQQLKGEK